MAFAPRSKTSKAAVIAVAVPPSSRIIPEAAPIPLPPKTKYSLDVSVAAGGGVTVTFPPDAAKYLGLPEGDPTKAPLYYLPLNGVIQVSAHEPGVSIPAVPIDADAFLAQTS